ncbi:ABC transporter permease [Actinomadura soli]|uniref:Transport permease protein n=1 Tax=Actinomadura soli TaxID=2508997 RepID=A0A5C4JDS8_9ACTN|nr:ABC transporter permease [Actinomadura soli]TMR02595.1 ABC transporter permease [Actinomadura soli]
MISRNCLLIANRVLRELRRDYRTLFLFTMSPLFVMILVAGMLVETPRTFDRSGLLVMGLFPTAPGFLFAAFAIQRERYRGSLEFLLSGPVTRLDVLVGYLLAFSVPAVAQVALTVSVSYGLLGLDSAGPWWAAALLAMLACVLGVVLGMFAINLAHNELQLTKVLPTVALPHLMVSGLFLPYEDMPGWMQAAATIAPWRYAVGAVSELHLHSSVTSELVLNLSVTVGIVFALSAVTVGTVLRRRTA